MSRNGFDSENDERPLPIGLLGRAFLTMGGFLAFLAAAIFLPAGDIGWRQGWVFVFVFFLLTVISVLYLWRKNPEIFIARSRIQTGTKTWDRVIITILLGSLFAIFPVAGFDHRLGWSSVPIWLNVVGNVLFAFGFFGSTWVYGVNKFAEPGVRIQTERGQKVVDCGPYAFVRHPLYLASIFLVIGVPLALGSFWAFLPVAVGIVALLVRTAWEDQLLYEELEGYKEYASRVRYRLIPGVW